MVRSGWSKLREDNGSWSFRLMFYSFLIPVGVFLQNLCLACLFHAILTLYRCSLSSKQPYCILEMCLFALRSCGALVYICFPPAVVEGLEGEKCGHVICDHNLFWISHRTSYQMGPPNPNDGWVGAWFWLVFLLLETSPIYTIFAILFLDPQIITWYRLWESVHLIK